MIQLDTIETIAFVLMMDIIVAFSILGIKYILNKN